MRLRHIPAARQFVAEHPLVISEQRAAAMAGQWRSLWGNQRDILALELGCGRGRFILNLAELRPDSCFIGLELREEVLMQALERQETLPENLRFLHANAELLSTMFADAELDELYINFPDPWPKNKHDKRRLTAPSFVGQYLRILRTGGRLRFKTDNADLFHWSVPNFSEADFVIECVDENVSEADSGVISEYEARFRRAGQPIHLLQVQKK